MSSGFFGMSSQVQDGTKGQNIEIDKSLVRTQKKLQRLAGHEDSKIPSNRSSDMMHMCNIH